MPAWESLIPNNRAVWQTGHGAEQEKSSDGQFGFLYLEEGVLQESREYEGI